MGARKRRDRRPHRPKANTPTTPPDPLPTEGVTEDDPPPEPDAPDDDRSAEEIAERAPPLERVNVVGLTIDRRRVDRHHDESVVAQDVMGPGGSILGVGRKSPAADRFGREDDRSAHPAETLERARRGLDGLWPVAGRLDEDVEGNQDAHRPATRLVTRHD
jgi:hypothetical protein